MSRRLWFLVVVLVVAGVCVVLLLLLGLVIFFRGEIGDRLFGPHEPASGTRLVYELRTGPGESPPDAAPDRNAPRLPRGRGREARRDFLSDSKSKSDESYPGCGIAAITVSWGSAG